MNAHTASFASGVNVKRCGAPVTGQSSAAPFFAQPSWRITLVSADVESAFTRSFVPVSTRVAAQPFFVAQVFTGAPGKLVDLQDTIKGFKGLVEGKYDHLPEAAFYMVGTIEEAVEKGKRLAAEAA